MKGTCLRKQISSVMSDSNSFEEFQSKLLEAYGISVHESRGRLSYLTPDRTKPIRARMLGTDFEKEYLELFFLGQVQSRQPHPVLHSREPGNQKLRSNAYPFKSKNPQYRSRASIRLTIDVEACVKAQENRYYAQTVMVTNLNQMSKTLLFLQENNIGTQEEFSFDS